MKHSLFAFALATILISTPAFSANSEKDVVLAANAGYFSALNIMFTGDVAPMLALWSHADDVTSMGPTGKYNRGWAAVKKDWEGQAAMKLGGKVEPTDINVVVGTDLAVISDTEIGTNTNADGKSATVSLRGTSVFRKEDGAWKMIVHHTDTLPYLDKK